MKIKKSQLRKMIKESVQEQSTKIAFEQKKTAHYAMVCLHNLPYLKEHKDLKSRKQLLEFFGPFKKLGVADLEKMGQEKETKAKAQAQAKDVKVIMKVAGEAEAARKQLAQAKLTDVASVEKALNNYVDRLHDLFELQKVADLDPKTKEQISKPFAAAAYTLQNLSQSLSDAADKLFQAVPRGSGIYSAGREAQDIEQAQKSFMMGPGQRLRQMGRDVLGMGGRGMGVGRGRPPA